MRFAEEKGLLEILDLFVDKKLRFVVVGGHAVDVYCEARQTADVDLLISKADRPIWISLLEGLGYQI